MPCASRDELPLQQITPTYSTRMAEWGAMTVGIEAAPAGLDGAASLGDLPDGRCQAHHWGYMLSGKIVGQAYYVEPGHKISFLEDSEAVEFTPTEELRQTLDAVRASVERDAG
jgi:hypothetical protein